jgi:excisionase family DNA binding protein
MDKQADQIPSFVTLQQAVKLLNLPADIIQRMIHRKELPALIVGGRWRIPRSAVTKMIAPSF